MSSRVRIALLVLPALALGGCRFRSFESFSSAVTPHEQSEVTWKGDPYAAGGLADATGGGSTATTYGAGSDPNSKSELDPTYDQPAKGTGLHPGDPTVSNRNGHGNTNAPALQPDPAEVGASTVRSAR